MDETAAPIVVASYNVHRCVGGDGRRDPARIAAVLREIDADVIALQEVDSESRHPEVLDQIVHLTDALACRAESGPTVRGDAGAYGNVLLTRGRFGAVRRLDLSWESREPRGAIDAEVCVRGVHLRVITAHLGLQARERRRQIARIVEAVPRTTARILVVLGDFNEWVPLSGTLDPLRRRLGREPMVRTFPARLPVLGLDKVWVVPRAALRDVRVHRSPLARQASDHLPVVARIHPLSAVVAEEPEEAEAVADGGLLLSPPAEPSPSV